MSALALAPLPPDVPGPPAVPGPPDVPHPPDLPRLPAPLPFPVDPLNGSLKVMGVLSSWGCAVFTTFLCAK